MRAQIIPFKMLLLLLLLGSELLDMPEGLYDRV